jgi:prevent-host-death family protein
MIRIYTPAPNKTRRRPRHPESRHSFLQNAKARFIELVRRVRGDGPQRLTVHGRGEVVVISIEDFRGLKGDRSGEALNVAMKGSPNRDIDIGPKRDYARTQSYIVIGWLLGK